MLETAKGSGSGWSWRAFPLYVRILIGLVLGLVAGVVLGERAQTFDLPAKLVLRVLGALAPVIVFLAVVNALVTADVRGRMAGKLGGLLLINSFVAICVGLFVANVLRPGSHASLTAPGSELRAPKGDVIAQLLDNVPDSLLRPFVDNKVIGVVLIALAIGIAGRKQTGSRRELLVNGLGLAFDLVIQVLHFVIAAVPFAVFGKIASIVGTAGFAPFRALGAFVAAVLLALVLQLGWYLLRIRLKSSFRPLEVVRGMRDALVMAFSTASSTATMPVTYERLKALGLRERSSSLGALVALHRAAPRPRPDADGSIPDRADEHDRVGRRRGHPRGGARHDDAGVHRRESAHRVHRPAPTGRLVPRPLPHGDKRDG
jgi:Na+/H+-dicarboxylate symporter